MVTKKDKNDPKSYENTLADIEEIEPRVDPDEYLLQSYRDDDKVNLIMSLVRIAELKRETEDLKRLRIIQMRPRNMWKTEHFKELLALKAKYTGKDAPIVDAEE